MSDQAPHQAPIPPELQKKLDSFKAKLWKIKIAEAVLAGVFGILFSYLLVFISDRLWETPSWLILCFFILGVFLFFAFTPFWIHRWVWGHRRESKLARLIAKKHPRFGDQLLGVIELQDQDSNQVQHSERLRDAAMLQVAAEAQSHDFDQAVPAPKHRLWTGVVALVIALCAAAIFYSPEAGLNAFKRWLSPLNPTERYTFTSLEDIPNVLPIPIGESFHFEVKLKPNSKNKPSSATARIVGSDWLTSQNQDNRYHFDFPGQQAEVWMEIQAGDARKQVLLQPRTRPTILQAKALITLPSYLERPQEQADIRGGVLSILQGSTAQITAQASDAIASAHFTAPKDSPEAKVPAPAPMNVSGSELISPAFICKSPGSAEFTWTDQFGFNSPLPYKIQVDPIEDMAPGVYTQGTEKVRMILDGETIEFELLADDDYGLKAIGLEYQGEFVKPSPGSPAKGEILLEKGNPQALRLASKSAFSSAALSIAPQKLTIRAYAEDYLPGRKRSYSEPITLFILDKSEHAQMLKAQLDQLISELEAAARREENELNQNQLLDQEALDKLQEAKNLEKLERSAANENENKEKIKDLNLKLEELFKQATRNDRIEKDALKKLANLNQQLKDIESKEMPKVESHLRDSANKRNTPEKTKSELQEGIKDQKTVIEKMKKAIEDARETSKNMEATTFVARLKQAAKEENGIADLFTSAMDKMIGRLIDEVSTQEQQFLQQSENSQRKISSDISWIVDDLQNYIKRTDKEVYQQVHKAMVDAQLQPRLEKLTQRISSNHGNMSITQARELAKELNAWAKMIDDSRKDPNGGGGGGSSREDNLDDQNFEFMLKVMRMIQSEQELRARTRAIEQIKRANKPESPSPKP